ncbi:hypothetical protein OU798_17050 [Prolixibacteraceae bacterium Z1-6]|uniref:Uncharacterized protein n=1 Tax=Draconibacterium aestuarii TaxID=2998507 RepID=A0A9X3FG17_9BACT|nr:hypothetical protein [Prolixibacteraceae bacterium Z1-6]
MKNIVKIFALLLIIGGCSQPARYPKAPEVKQQALARIDQMPDFPQPYKMLNWNQKAHLFDKLVFDSTQTGEYWPLIWTDNSAKNFDQKTFGLYTAMGDVRQGLKNNDGIFHESLTTMGAVLGASLVGIDKSNQDGNNYVNMLRNYFNSDTNWDIMMNNTCPEVALLGGGYGRDWWYDVFPNVLYYAVCDFYPNEKNTEPILRSIADKFYQADSILNGNYNYTFFNYGTMSPEENWICHQQDAAAGHAYVLYSAYKRFGDQRYLEGAKSSIEALLSLEKNTFYEILMPFGAYVATRLNAEEGTDYEVRQLLEWTFNGDTECREGWGVLADNWNGYDVSGLVGSTIDHGGYGFLMNTFDAAWALVPMVRYDASWAQALGKWMLNAANVSRLFYPDEIPDEHQTSPELKQVAKGVIGYEGLVKISTFDEFKDIKAPVAQGDGPHWVQGENPWASQLSVYGSAHIGIFGSIISTTNVEGVLQLDLLACDFYRDDAYPTYMYYNPYTEEKLINIDLGNENVKLYDLLTHSFIDESISGSYDLSVAPGQSRVLVITPENGKLTFSDGKVAVDGVVIDYQNKVEL